MITIQDAGCEAMACLRSTCCSYIHGEQSCTRGLRKIRKIEKSFKNRGSYNQGSNWRNGHLP